MKDEKRLDGIRSQKYTYLNPLVLALCHSRQRRKADEEESERRKGTYGEQEAQVSPQWPVKGGGPRGPVANGRGVEGRHGNQGG